MKSGTASPHAADPRIDELRVMGLPQMWIEAAEIIGFDAFLALWRYFDRQPGVEIADGRLELRLRRYASYLRFQRNNYIERLYLTGMSLRKIQTKLKGSLRESVSLRHIHRIAKKT